MQGQKKISKQPIVIFSFIQKVILECVTYYITETSNVTFLISIVLEYRKAPKFAIVIFFNFIGGVDLINCTYTDRLVAFDKVKHCELLSHM